METRKGQKGNLQVEGGAPAFNDKHWVVHHAGWGVEESNQPDYNPE